MFCRRVNTALRTFFTCAFGLQVANYRSRFVLYTCNFPRQKTVSGILTTHVHKSTWSDLQLNKITCRLSHVFKIVFKNNNCCHQCALESEGNTEIAPICLEVHRFKSVEIGQTPN